jgi:hypothetical protein
MAKRKPAGNPPSGAAFPAAPQAEIIDATALFTHVAAIIENRKIRAYAHVNQETTMMFWEVGRYINSAVLDHQRAAYGKKILSALAAKLVAKYGKNFGERNLYRMTLFVERFPDPEILPMLSAKF